MESAALLQVNQLQTSFKTEDGRIRALDGVSFQVEKGKTLAVVGESGCGKSVTAMSIMGLVQEANGKIDGGQILFDGTDLAALKKEEMRAIRGNKISMIFQEPMTALNPVYTIGEQIGEVFRIHRGMSRKQARQEALRMLKLVSIPAPEKRIDEYPFQLSGGMRQRIVIAMALACEPSLLIADEPTTALDVTIQAQIIRLMKRLQEEKGTSIMFITHDLGVVAEVADHVVVMYAGKAVEYGPVRDIFKNPSHPYTKGLLKSIPSLDDHKDNKLFTIEGTVPGLKNLPQGCRFNTRCHLAQEECFKKTPEFTSLGDSGHKVACYEVGGK
ncbi:ABC transporter ATP-binding protein [Pseudobacteriovorax antillogorgiicola]|uniref:Peptide/nickel transport system ATP-binding protein/oligopeptide transport system ATP-binding protein n=1 Tax=Pseudobacteriovorax antillogorgiicola TaxID=1513793 RepID=A0A1Y6CKR5_9BACT|nr:ABC transporter ATP-binding protein [Pseudobacteriovorax antillogorgiicola]TCS45629.1 peptide/nickel transport system ATP-binding protein/oligopeptide transport system ATP-binding protein [Pseudobacteriovorax antillogorgiicola]SMF72502.1 peptide/nickel transport system ATP-binding protein/oligopeptide transport system ATP-binding protein [Pseudobacteriovorax antillogorgiicola]